MTEWVLTVVFALLVMGLMLSFTRLVRGPSLADRVIALELIALTTVALILTHAMHTNVSDVIDVALVLALTGFMAAVGFARFLERGGAGK